jgi:hypothetical protein
MDHYRCPVGLISTILDRCQLVVVFVVAVVAAGWGTTPL